MEGKNNGEMERFSDWYWFVSPRALRGDGGTGAVERGAGYVQPSPISSPSPEDTPVIGPEIGQEIPCEFSAFWGMEALPCHAVLTQTRDGWRVDVSTTVKNAGSRVVLNPDVNVGCSDERGRHVSAKGFDSRPPLDSLGPGQSVVVTRTIFYSTSAGECVRSCSGAVE